MAAILEKLDVPRNVRLFFEPFFEVCPDGSLRFRFGNEFEHFGKSIHRVPTALVPWTAGDGPLLFVSFNAMEALAFLSLNFYRFPDLSALRFVATGNYPVNLPAYPYQKCGLIFGKDLLGSLADIRVAALLTGNSVNVCYQDGFMRFGAGGRNFRMAYDSVSLHAFRRCAGWRINVRSYKPKGADSFLQLLLAGVNS
jgi:hypothetical protein